jgi:hypothetical protein
MAADLGCKVLDLVQDKEKRASIDLKKYVRGDVGLPTLKDILKEIEKPGLDPRGAAKSFEFANVRSLDDLHPGMILPGIVTNITNFGHRGYRHRYGEKVSCLPILKNYLALIECEESLACPSANLVNAANWTRWDNFAFNFNTINPVYRYVLI